MTDPEYLATQRAIIAAAQAVMTLDLNSFLGRISHAEAVGAVLDPTLYRKAHRNLERVRELAEALQSFKRVAMKLREEVIMDLGGEGES